MPYTCALRQLSHAPRKPARHSLSTISLWICLALASTAVAAQPADEQERAELRDFLEKTIHTSDSFSDRFEAEVWLVDMSARLERFVKSPEKRLALLRDIHFAATRAELSPELVLAVIEVESHFDRFAISRVGAQGMMQVMPFWKNEIGRPDDNLTAQKANLEYGCRILQFYLDRKKGRLHEALAAYNGSTGTRVYSNKVYEAWLSHWRTETLDWGS